MTKFTISNVITAIKKDVAEMGAGQNIALITLGFLIGLLVFH